MSAREVGVHSVHLSRQFARCYGLLPSRYRARLRTARALRAVMAGEAIADAALAAGLADQSHFTRWARRQTGLAPKHLHQLLNA